MAEGTGTILAQGVAGTSAAAIYGPLDSTNRHVEIRKLVICNENSSSPTVNYGVLKSGGTLGASGTLTAKTYPLGAVGTVTATLDATELTGMVLGNGDSLVLWASTGTGVGYTVSGVSSPASA